MTTSRTITSAIKVIIIVVVHLDFQYHFEIVLISLLINFHEPTILKKLDITPLNLEPILPLCVLVIIYFYLMWNSCRRHPSIYESVHDLKTEQHANLIFGEKLEARMIKIAKHAPYEEIDEQLPNLVSSFHTYPRKKYFQKARAIFNF